MALYGINCVNRLGQSRSRVYNAKNFSEAEIIFFNRDYHYENDYKINQISKINTEVCNLLFQSYSEVVKIEKREFRINIVNERPTVEIDDIMSYGTVVFKENDLHCDGDILEVMVCVHDGEPNWLY